jgi:TonB-dependent SusC/RagA subfamily outer membrane receptor
MKNSKSSLACLLAIGILTPLCSQSVKASAPDINVVQQSSSITGTVTDGTDPIIGATIKVKGDKAGAITDLDGKFSIKVRPGTMLEISYVGYITTEVKARQGMTVVLKEDNKALDEVVVTALGIKRERKALGYGVGEVKGEELQKAKETNVINSLAGKVAGLVVSQTAGGASGSTRVILRGSTEMTGNNQPLYVVDGVPLDNTNFGSAGTYGGYDLGDGISSINPDDIETMSVLKGPAASALYGSRAATDTRLPQQDVQLRTARTLQQLVGGLRLQRHDGR